MARLSTLAEVRYHYEPVFRTSLAKQLNTILAGIAPSPERSLIVEAAMQAIPLGTYKLLYLVSGTKGVVDIVEHTLFQRNYGQDSELSIGGHPQIPKLYVLRDDRNLGRTVVNVYFQLIQNGRDA